jgi:hypothetical protein
LTPPHAEHEPPVHTVFVVAHALLSATHCVLVGSQQPLVQLLPAQHGCPVPPHAAHVPPLQIAPLPQVLPAQHGSPAPPHAAHEPPLHTVLDAVHALPLATHCVLVGSQHAPPLHELPPQHG